MIQYNLYICIISKFYHLVAYWFDLGEGVVPLSIF